MKKKLKVMLLINSFNLGGAEKLSYDIASELNKHNVEIHLVSMAPVSSKIEKNLFNDMKDCGIFVHSIDKPYGRGKLSSILKIYKYLKKYNIDIIHSNGQSPDFYGRIASIFDKNIRTIVTIHNTKGYSKKIESILKYNTDGYTAVSNETKKYMIEELKINKDISVILNGIDIKRYESNDKNDNKFRVLSIGRIMEQKNYNGIIEEMSNYLKDNESAEWYIVGSTEFSGDYYEKFKSLIPNEIKDRIICTGVVEDAENYYKKANCFLLNSSYEGFGIVFIEAMASKIPVICRNVGIIPEIMEKGGQVYLLEENNVTYYLDKLKGVHNLTEILQKNYDIVKSNYSIEKIAKMYLEIYLKTLKK